MNNPLVSIVICCHNRRSYLEQTLKSVLSQNYAPVEIIILDDGSTDGTDELVARYGNKVRYQWQHQQGIAAARNAACKLAKGELIAFQDDDDLMEPNRIVELYRALCEYPSAVFATGGYAIIDMEGNLTGRQNLPSWDNINDDVALINDAYRAILWPEIPANPHTTLFRRSDGERIGWFDTAFKYSASDKDFYARLALLGPVVYVKKIVSYYRRGHSSIWSSSIRAAYGSLQLWQKHLNLMSLQHEALRQRLLDKTLRVLRQIARGESEGDSVNTSEAQVLRARAIALLDPMQRMNYAWYRSIKLPIRRLVKRNG